MNTRQQIIDALETLLNTTSGLENKVYCWRQEAFQPAELPAATFGDMQGSAEPLAGGWTQHNLSVQVQILAAGSDAAVQVRTLAENLLTVFSAEPLLGDLLDSSEFRGIEMAGDLAAHEIVAGNIEIDMKYQTANWQI